MFLESCKGSVFRGNKSNERFRYPFRSSRLHNRNSIGSMGDQFAVVKHYPLPAIIVPVGLEPELVRMRSYADYRAVRNCIGIMLDAVLSKASFKKPQQPLLIGERQAGYCSHQLVIIHLRHYMPALFNLVSIDARLQSWQSARSTSHLIPQVYICSIKTSSRLKNVRKEI
jgi:hypothetical protein